MNAINKTDCPPLNQNIPTTKAKKHTFENLMSSWRVWILFSKLPHVVAFLKIVPKVRCFQNTSENGLFSNFDVQLGRLF